MTVHASHQGIQYQLEEIRDGEWRWSFTPPTGARRTGRVVGGSEWAVTVVQRAIDVWHMMNRPRQTAAA
jgi:hypothetical protein